MQIIFILEQVLNGLLIGAFYLLIALGLSLIFSLGGSVNLAHGAFYAIGAYLTIVLAPHIGFGGAMIASPVLVALIGIVIERGLFQRFYRSDPILSLLLTFGLAMVAHGIVDWSQGWAWVKAVAVIAMSGIHGMLGGYLRAFREDRNTKPQRFFRIINEVPTVLMIIIVIAVIVRPF